MQRTHWRLMQWVSCSLALLTRSLTFTQSYSLTEALTPLNTSPTHSQSPKQQNMHVRLRDRVQLTHSFGDLFFQRCFGWHVTFSAFCPVEHFACRQPYFTHLDLAQEIRMFVRPGPVSGEISQASACFASRCIMLLSPKPRIRTAILLTTPGSQLWRARMPWASS